MHQLFCHNTLQIRGDKNLVEECLEKIGLTDVDTFTFDNILPPPSEYFDGTLTAEQLEEKYGYESALDWRQENWDFCGDVRDICYDEKNDAFHFRTVGEDAAPVITELSKQFPPLEFALATQRFDSPSVISLDINTWRIINGKSSETKRRSINGRSQVH